mmetsp:Transcript_23239/g.28553  ORF Transcript_23239/g.28553 Transcript_23239/m.28553 type:complete len:599 (-) Transcript_23239:255-2051(-)
MSTVSDLTTPQQQLTQQQPAPQYRPSNPNPEDAASHITVSDPVQHTEGMNKYTSYRVDVRGSIDPRTPDALAHQDPMNQNQNRGVITSPDPSPYHQSSDHTAVMRRYSDFVWLSNQLTKERGGAIIPPLPEKQAVARLNPIFVEDRRQHLEKFLRRLALHPELHTAQCLHTFLRADDGTFQVSKQVPDPMKSGYLSSDQSYAGGASMAPSPPATKGIKQWFAETKTNVSINMGLFNPENLVQSPDDELFAEIERYVLGLEDQMKAVLGQATILVRKGKEIANGMFEFGLAFTLLGQSEGGDNASSDDTLAGALARMGSASDTLSLVSSEHANAEEKQFEAPLKDYIRTITCVKAALKIRTDRRLTYTTRLADLNAKQSNLERLRMLNSEKSYMAGLSVQAAQGATDAAREEFATVSQRLLREMDRFKREKAEDMRRTVLEYIELQVGYNQRMEEIWAGVIPALEGVDLSTNLGGVNVAGVNNFENAVPQPQQQAYQGQPQQQQVPQQQVHQPQPTMVNMPPQRYAPQYADTMPAYNSGSSGMGASTYSTMGRTLTPNTDPYAQPQPSVNANANPPQQTQAPNPYNTAPRENPMGYGAR